MFPPVRPLLEFVLIATVPFSLYADASKVALSKTATGYELQVNGQPFVVRGVGGTQNLTMLKELGGNSVRTWGVESLSQPVDGKPLIDRAQELGLMVVGGIWLQHERHGFNYSDPKKIEEQRAKVLAAVRQYKDHPALLVWGLGNEMEGPMASGKDPRIWKEVNYLAGEIKKLDPNHPVMTVMAGAAADKVRGFTENCTNVDILGVNAYAGASGIGEAVQAAGWKKPFILAEFGPVGHWEVPKTSWGAPIEATSTSKAGSYFATQSILMEKSKSICLGSFAFLWGWKQEVTATWYGMFLPGGVKLGPVDAMCYAWTGKWPTNRCPSIQAIQSDFSETVVGAGKTGTASVKAKDPEGKPLSYQWDVVAESTSGSVGGDHEDAPPSFPNAIVSTKENEVTIRFPDKPGAYRLFLVIKDDGNSAATANIPFKVQ